MLGVCGRVRRWWCVCVVVVVSCVLVVFPVVGAYATNVLWGPVGYGWFSKAGNDVYNAYKRLDVDHEVSHVYPDGRKHVKYTFKWNKPDEKGERDQAAFSGRVWLFTYLPRGLDDSSIRITREKDVLKLGINKRWERQTVAEAQSIGEFHDSNTRKAGLYPEDSFNQHWKDGFSQTQPNPGTDVGHSNDETTCDVLGWKDSGRFSRSLWSYENGGLTTHYWTVEADVSADFDPDLEPVLMGYDSGNTVSHEDFYMAYGPYDTDNDGVPDVTEEKLGTNPYAGDVAFPEVKGAEYGSVLTSRPYVQHGSLQFDQNRNKWYFAQDSDATQKVESLPLGMHFELKGQLPAGVVQVGSKDNLRDGQVYLDKTSGEVSFRPGPQHHGQKIDFRVGTVFKQSTQCRAQLREETVASFSLVKQSDLYDPVYTDTSVQAGTTKQSEAPRDKDAAKTLPAGTKFEITEEGKRAHPWATINPETGVITFTPSRHIELKDYYIPVTVTYPDTSTDTTSAKVTITKAPLQKGDFALTVAPDEILVHEGHQFPSAIDVQAIWKYSDSKIDLEMVCSAQGEPQQNLTSEETGWALQDTTVYQAATPEQEAALAKGGAKVPATLYKNDEAAARTDARVYGVGKKGGTYQCAVFASSNMQFLKSAHMNSAGGFDNQATGTILQGLKGTSWDSKVFTVRVISPVLLPLTGGVGEYIFWLIGGSILLLALLAGMNNLRWVRVQALRASRNGASTRKGVVEL